MGSYFTHSQKPEKCHKKNALNRRGVRQKVTCYTDLVKGLDVKDALRGRMKRRVDGNAS